MYSDDDLLSISGIQHFVFCRRQWALIHIERQWSENYLTADGRIMHEHAHDDRFTEVRGGVIISRGIQVTSRRLGLYGVCDVAEFTPSGEGAKIFGRPGLYSIIPVEYKHGEPKESDADILQTAAQAVCLEDMFCTTVHELDIFYGKTKHRQRIEFTDEIRQRLNDVIREMRALYERQYTLKVKPGKQCRACSLRDICLPKLQKTRSVKKYIGEALSEAGEKL